MLVELAGDGKRAVALERHVGNLLGNRGGDLLRRDAVLLQLLDLLEDDLLDLVVRGAGRHRGEDDG